MIAYVLDEHFRGALWHAIQTHNARSPFPIHAVCVGDPADLPLGSKDPIILQWAERRGCILLTRDKRTMPTHVLKHLQSGNQTSGVFVIRDNVPLQSIVDYLAVVAHASEAFEWTNRMIYIP